MELTHKRWIMAVLVLALCTALAFQTLAAPQGATISNNSTETASGVSPDAHSAARSTITTMILDSTQQDQFWKGYVGNVTGALSLDDASGSTIYDWALTTITGEVYGSRSNSLDFSTVSCAAGATITSENTFHNMSQGQIDNINATFNATGHQGFTVGSTSINADTCPSQALYVNSAAQGASSSADFQEVVLEDNAGDLFFTSIINDDTTGFDGDVYDFQMIVPESNIKATPTTYYFYLELG